MIQRAIRKYRGAQQEGKPDLDERRARRVRAEDFRCRIKKELRIHQDFLMVKPGSVNIAADVLLYVFSHLTNFRGFKNSCSRRLEWICTRICQERLLPGPIVGPDGQPVPKWMLLQKFDDVAVGGQDSFSKLFSDLETKENRDWMRDWRRNWRCLALLEQQIYLSGPSRRFSPTSCRLRSWTISFNDQVCRQLCRTPCS